MKKQILSFSLAAVFGALALMSSSGGPANSVLVGDKTMDGCVNCHGMNNSATIVNLQMVDDVTSLPVTNLEYVPGRTYTIVDLGTNPNAGLTHFGFQTVTANSANATVGQFTILNNNIAHYFSPTPSQPQRGVEQKVPIARTGNTCNPQLKWTAPPAGTGDVQFRIALNMVNNDGTMNGDEPNKKKFILKEKSAASVAGLPETGMRLFPNPTHGDIALNLGDAAEGHYTLKAIDVNGKVTMLRDIRSSGKDKSFNLSTAGLAAGLYHLVLTGPRGMEILKFVRQ